MNTTNDTNMTSNELKSAIFLSAIYATRMLGLFLIFPTFSLLAGGLEGATTFKIGLALGIYSLSQAVLQIPAGILSDIFGRKKVLYAGLIIFLLGSILASLTNDINTIIFARFLQGAGAVSAVCLAYVADNIRKSQQGKVMAMIGMSIASSFIISFVLGSIISEKFGLSGLFVAISILASLALICAFLLPSPHQHLANFKMQEFWEVVKRKRMISINLQIAALHMLLSASFFIIPMLVTKGFGDNISYLKFYLPSILIAFAFVLPLMRKREKAKQLMMIKWFVLSFSLFLFGLPFSFNGIISFIAVMSIFFFAFTYIEAMLPTILFSVVTDKSRGAVSGVYSVYQYMGNFLGGILGAQLYSLFISSGTINYSFYILAAIAFCVFVANFIFRKVG